MKPTCCLCLLLWIATGCTYNPVRFDPVTGFNTGGGVGVLCGGPLDPWMLHCCPDSDCCLCSCLKSCFCSQEPSCLPAPVCAPMCSPSPVCAPMCSPAPVCAPFCPPAPVCAPVCPPANMYPSPGMPLGPTGVGMPYPGLPGLPPTGGMMQPGIPMSQQYGVPSYPGSGPVPTYAEPPCPTCGPQASAMAPGYPQTVQTPLPGVTNYPQLFQNPPPAPPADGFMMPTPIPEAEPASVHRATSAALSNDGNPGRSARRPPSGAAADARQAHAHAGSESAGRPATEPHERPSPGPTTHARDDADADGNRCGPQFRPARSSPPLEVRCPPAAMGARPPVMPSGGLCCFSPRSAM